MAVTDANARAAGFATPIGTNLISGGDDAIRQNARTALDLINAARFAKDTILPTGDLDTIEGSCVRPFWAGANGAPSDLSGTVFQTELTTTAGVLAQKVQFAISPSTAGSRMDVRFTGSAGWSAWDRLDSGAIDVTGLAGPSGGGSPASFKTVPLALTVGGGISDWEGTNGGVRMPVSFGAPVQRWRAHFRNINPREGADRPGTAVITNVVFAEASTAGYPSNGAYAHIANNLDVAKGTATPWQNTPLEAGKKYILNYRWSASAPPRRVVGGGWLTSFSGSNYFLNSATTTPTASMPLDVWIEAEVAPDVPVVAAFGDSLSSGVGATLPVYDSWLSQWCRANGALPVHYTASGDTMAGWGDSNAYKWQRWQNLSRPDCVIHAMGSNDVFGGATLATMKERRAKSLDQLRALVSTVIYSATVLPRNGVSGVLEDTRRAYNAYVLSLPDVARDAFNFVPAVSADDENIAPGVNADGVHLTTIGYRDVSRTINRPIVYTPTT